MRLSIANPEASEPFDYAHPRSCHTGDVQALIGLIVVIIQVKPCCAEVHFYGLGFKAQFGREHHVYTRTQAALVDGSGLVKLKVLPVGGCVKCVFKKVQALQGVSLLDEYRTQNAVPAPMLVDGGALYRAGLLPSLGLCP